MQDNPFDQFDAAPGVVIKRKDPLEQAIQQANLAKMARDAAEAAQTTPYAGVKAKAEAQKAVADAKKAQEEANSDASKADPRLANVQKELQADNVLSQIGVARDQIAQGHATGNFFGTGAYQGIPGLGQNSANLAATIKGLQGSTINDTISALKAMSANGASGYGSLTETEAERLANSVATLSQTQDAESLRRGLANLELHYRNAKALLNGEDPRLQSVQKKYGVLSIGDVGSSNNDNGDPPLSLSQNGYERQADPTLKGVNSTVRSMIGSGRNPGDIVGYLNNVSPGLGDKKAGDVSKAVAFRNQHPDVPLSRYTIDLEGKQVPLSPIHNLVNEAAQSPFGAFAMNAGDAITGGYLDNMTSNPALARAGMKAVSDANQTAAPLGQVAGGAAASLGLEGLAGLKLAPALAARVGDATYGALYGSGNADDGNRLVGAGVGGLTGLVGGAAGRRATKFGSNLIGGVTDKAKQILAQAGIPSTVGQTLGGTAKSLEDRLSGYWGVGDVINARRREGLTAVQKKAFNDAVSPIGGSIDQIGENGVASGLRQVGDAYDSALKGKAVTADAPYIQGITQTAQNIANIPRVGPELHSAIDSVVSPMFNGRTLSGESMQAIDRGLQNIRSGYSNDPLFSTHIAPALDAVGDHIDGMFQRQLPDVLPQYQAAKNAYRNMSVLADAVNSGVNTGGEFSMAQLGQQSRRNAIKFGGRNAAASGNRPFAELQRAAQEVLPSKVPDNGTAGRLALPLAATAVGGGIGYGKDPNGEDVDRGSNAAKAALALGAAATLGYSRPVQSVVSKALLAERPQVVQQAAELLARQQRLAGLLGTAGASNYYLGP